MQLTAITRSPPDVFINRLDSPPSNEPDQTFCASCFSGNGELIYGEDPDGFVLCRECRSPLFYCDVGGQG